QHVMGLGVDAEIRIRAWRGALHRPVSAVLVGEVQPDFPGGRESQAGADAEGIAMVGLGPAVVAVFPGIAGAQDWTAPVEMLLQSDPESMLVGPRFAAGGEGVPGVPVFVAAPEVPVPVHGNPGEAGLEGYAHLSLERVADIVAGLDRARTFFLIGVHQFQSF